MENYAEESFLFITIKELSVRVAKRCGDLPAGVLLAGGRHAEIMLSKAEMLSIEMS